MPLKFAYYCSGHGYGHATRVSAFASALLELIVKPQITIISSAPKRVFTECISRGAQYRQADIDPIVIQPVAYTVDRWQSVEALRKFLEEKDNKLTVEVAWLFSEKIDCVLSDAAFLGCEAATKACIPSILITNFTFDSVYSYLGVHIKRPSVLPLAWDCDDNSLFKSETDIPVPIEVLEPLVSQLETGYRHADVLILLPGHIPIPSFFRHPPLPASNWIDPTINRLLPELREALHNFSDNDLHASIPFPTATSFIAADSLTVKFPFHKKPNRFVKQAPLLVRPTSADMASNFGKRRLLSSIGIPAAVQDQPDLRVLVISFGGQAIGRPHGRKTPLQTTNITDNEHQHTHSETGLLTPPELPVSVASTRPVSSSTNNNNTDLSPYEKSIVNGPSVVIDPTQQPPLLPSRSWIAIVCGVPSKWSSFGTDSDDTPPGFYFAPPDIYMPDLTAIADVLRYKGYGTVSECIAQGTPLVYVPRPLFVEEHGLRQWLEAEGTGIEMSQEEYESGLWTKKLQTAYELCNNERKKGIDHQKNSLDIRRLATWVVNYVETWQCGV